MGHEKDTQVISVEGMHSIKTIEVTTMLQHIYEIVFKTLSEITAFPFTPKQITELLQSQSKVESIPRRSGAPVYSNHIEYVSKKKSPHDTLVELRDKQRTIHLLEYEIISAKMEIDELLQQTIDDNDSERFTRIATALTDITVKLQEAQVNGVTREVIRVTTDIPKQLRQIA